MQMNTDQNREVLERLKLAMLEYSEAVSQAIKSFGKQSIMIDDTIYAPYQEGDKWRYKRIVKLVRRTFPTFEEADSARNTLESHGIKVTFEYGSFEYSIAVSEEDNDRAQRILEGLREEVRES